MMGGVQAFRLLWLAVEMVSQFVQSEAAKSPSKTVPARLNWQDLKDYIQPVAPLPAHYVMRDYAGNVVFDSKRPSRSKPPRRRF